MPHTFAFLVALAACSLAMPAEESGSVSIDTEEWRNEPVRHLYVHGLLNGQTAFQVRLPEKPAFKGRLIQYLQGGLGGSERAGEAVGQHAYALANGAVYAESSQGRRGQTLHNRENRSEGGADTAVEVSLAVARYAKARAVALYGKEPRYRYLHGQSAGGIRSSGMLERYPELWDGAVAFVGVGADAPVVQIYSVYENLRMKIAGKVREMADATLPGGSGDPFAVLDTAEQRGALRTLLRAGYPARQLAQLEPSLVTVQVMDLIRYAADPSYYGEFWTKPGYLGAAGGLKADVIEGVLTSVNPRTRVIEYNLRRGRNQLAAYTLTFTSGDQQGAWHRVWSNDGAAAILSPTGPAVAQVKPGDKFTLDNRDLIAFANYYRYLAPANFPYLSLDSTDSNAPRRNAAAQPGSQITNWKAGDYKGKLIAVFSVDDQYAWPTVALAYRDKVRRALGQKIDDHFRLHFLQHLPHVASSRPNWEIRWPNPLRRAMDDLMLWVEGRGKPQPGTGFTVDDWNQVVLPPSAKERCGYQPVVALSANGKQGRIEARVGEQMTFHAEAEDPDNDLVSFDIDFAGDGRFDESKQLHGRKASADFRYSYSQPGTYFAAIRVTDSTAPLGATESGIQNLAHVRVIVRAAPALSSSGGVPGR